MSDRPAPQPGERLAKVIARAGVCSRRDAETWITAGRISVNGSVVKTPAFNVIEADTVAVDGKEIARRQPTQLWLYHKPAGLMVTEKDPEGRPTVFDALARLGLPRVVTVGRLDYNTEGLLLVTNDGGLKRTLELPSTGWVRRYRVRAFGSVTQETLNTLKDGITVDGIEYGPIEAELDSVNGANVWVTVALREGKNREVRNVFSAIGLEVNRLIRISYGPFQLGDLTVGSVEKVKTRILQDQLGKRLAEAAGADFSSPDAMEEGNQPRRRGPERPDSRPTERDRFGGLRKRPERKADDRREEAPRLVHFDDGSPSQTHIPRGKPNRDRDGARGGRPERGEGFKKRFDDGPRKPREDGERSFRKGPRPEGASGDRPFRSGPRREAASGDRPFRKDGFKPRFDRDGGEGAGRPPRRDAPYKPREDGGRPFRSGPRPDGGSGDRPFRKGPRPEGSGGDRPFRSGPRRDGPSGDRPFRSGPRPQGDAGAGRPPRRDGGKPFGNGPRREFDGERPQRRKDEDRPLARRTGPGRPDRAGEDRGPRRDGGKPFDKGSRGSAGPRGPRKDGGRPGGGKPFSGPRRPKGE